MVCLDEVRHVERHLLDLRVVELLDVLEVAHVALLRIEGGGKGERGLFLVSQSP